MDPNVRYVDDVKPMIENNLYRVRGVEGVRWAVPLYKGNARAKVNPVRAKADEPTVIEQVILLGLDDSSMVGAPPPERILVGQARGPPQARRGVRRLHPAPQALPRPAARATTSRRTTGKFLGRELEMNDHRAIIVGICEASRTFQSNPVVYTTYSRAKGFVPQERKILSYILAKTEPGRDPEDGRRARSGDRPASGPGPARSSCGRRSTTT